MQYKILSIIVLLSLFFVLASDTGCSPASQDVAVENRAEKNYTRNCASCHGEKMIAFADRDWKHGKSDTALLASLSHSWEKNIPAFDSILSVEEKKELVRYILGGIENAGKYLFKGDPTSNVFQSDSLSFKLDTVFSGVQNPWSIAFLPEGQMLITERSGKLYLVNPGKEKQEIKGLPEVVAEGQGGLLDIKLDPAYPTNKAVYLSFAKGEKTDSGVVTTTAVVSASFDGTTLKNVKEIFVAQPYQKTRHHYGGRLEFGKDGTLYITVGDRGKEGIAPQSLQHDAGKIHRINTDGTVPPNNPYANAGGQRATVFSYGHRNPQGMTIHPVTGEIWENEHGPRGGDEINIAQQGKNYGWPLISYGINYDGKPITDASAKDGLEQPLFYWTPSIGPSGMAFVQGDKYKGWKNALLVGSLRFRFLSVNYLDGNKVTREEAVMKNVGRVRDVRMGPDGFVYVAVESPGYVFRIVPIN